MNDTVFSTITRLGPTLWLVQVSLKFTTTTALRAYHVNNNLGLLAYGGKSR